MKANTKTTSVMAKGSGITKTASLGMKANTKTAIFMAKGRDITKTAS